VKGHVDPFNVPGLSGGYRAPSAVSRYFARQMPPQIVISAQVAFHSVVPTALQNVPGMPYVSLGVVNGVNYTKTTQTRRGAAKSS
jgi:hypothetical protein